MPPIDVLNFPLNTSNHLIVDAKQIICCEESLKALAISLNENEYGPGYTNLLNERIRETKRQLAQLKAKHNLE